MQPFPIQTYSFPSQHNLVISLDGVNLELTGHMDSSVSISGLSTDPDIEIDRITLEGEKTTQLTLSTPINADRSNTSITVTIPNDSYVKIIQGTGSVYVHGFHGHLDIKTISAPIRIHEVQGRVRAVSRRGTIQVSESDGEIDALAEADEIRLTGVRGQITGTNIMGDITFSGLLTDADAARFETDHGEVHINLDPESAAHINITSAGGRIVCTLPGMSGMFESCEGQYGIAGGSLEIRTVSGAIRLDQTP